MPLPELLAVMLSPEITNELAELSTLTTSAPAVDSKPRFSIATLPLSISKTLPLAATVSFTVGLASKPATVT